MRNSKSDELVLISHTLCPYVQRAAIALAEKNVAFSRIYIDLSDKPDWFMKISPLGKVPLLRRGDAVIFESAVILEYIEEITDHPLHPQSALERARHRSAIEFGSSILNSIAGMYLAADKQMFDAKVAELAQRFSWLENQLCGKTFYAGDTFSLVDAAFGPVFRYFDLFDQIGDFDILKRIGQRFQPGAKPWLNATPYKMRLGQNIQNFCAHLSKTGILTCHNCSVTPDLFSRLLNNPLDYLIKFFCHNIKCRHVICAKDRTWGAVRQFRSFIGIFSNIKTQWRFNSRRFTGFQHAHGKMRIENHHHTVASNGNADVLGPARGAGFGDYAHFIGAYGRFEFAEVTGERLARRNHHGAGFRRVTGSPCTLNAKGD